MIHTLSISHDQCAALCYEMNRMYSKHVMQERTLLPWEYADFEDRQGILTAIDLVLDGKTPEDLHESWLTVKMARGWTYGALYDLGQKTSPYLKPWTDLTDLQKAKDYLLYSIVMTFFLSI